MRRPPLVAAGGARGREPPRIPHACMFFLFLLAERVRVFEGGRRDRDFVLVEVLVLVAVLNAVLDLLCFDAVLEGVAVALVDTEPVAELEEEEELVGVAVSEEVSEALPVPVCEEVDVRVCVELAELVCVELGVLLRVDEIVPVDVWLAVPVCVEEGVSVCVLEGVPVRVWLAVAVCEGDGVPLCVDEREAVWEDEGVPD